MEIIQRNAALRHTREAEKNKTTQTQRHRQRL